MLDSLQETIDVLDAIYHRRSVRSYTDEVLGEAVIRELLAAAVQAPTAMHEEPWAFAVIQDKSVLKRYSDRAKAMQLASAGDLPKDMIKTLADPIFNIFYDAGTLIVICRKTPAIFADADCWLAAENLMLAATAEDLGSCCIGFALPVLNEADVRREIGIPEAGAAVAAIIIGKTRSLPQATARKPPEILRWMS